MVVVAEFDFWECWSGVDSSRRTTHLLWAVVQQQRLFYIFNMCCKELVLRTWVRLYYYCDATFVQLH